MSKPILETLAKEISTVAEGKGKDYSQIIQNIRNDAYPREDLVRDLVKAKLSYFARKLLSRYYEIQNKLEEENNGKTNS